MTSSTPQVVAFTFLSLWLLWGQTLHQTKAAFQLPPFLESLSQHSVGNKQGDGMERVFNLPASILNVPNLRRFTPRKKHLKVRKLMKRMRKDWDPFWMSVVRPAHADEEEVKEAPVDPTLVKALHRLNLTLRGSDGVSREMGVDMQHVIRLWLLNYSVCHVRYVWHDLGILYWPRWLRHGYCQASGDSPSSSSSSSSASSLPYHQPSSSLPPQSCSWPPGMHCVPAESRRVRILRWQCRHNKAFRNWKPRSRKVKKMKQQRAAVSSSGSRNRRSSRRSSISGRMAVFRAGNFSGRAAEEEEEEEESNDTENWSRKPFIQRRRKLGMRCKWKKIPYPVTDDCFCSC